jgi:hypothetical protein
MSDDIRAIKQPKLGPEKLELLDGAPVFDPSDLDEAIIEVYKLPGGEHVAVYDYDAIVAHHTKELGGTPTKDDDAYEQAVEWVDYNTCRAVPYMGARAPIIVRKPFEGELEDDSDPDLEERFLVIGGEKWLVVECPHDLPEFHPNDLADSLVQA